MNSYGEWSTANERYLGEALAWLRQRLEWLAGPSVVETPAVSDVEAKNVQSSFFGRFFDRGRTSSSPLALPAPDETSSGAAQTPPPVPVPATMIEAESAEHPPALVLLSRRLGLSEFERYTLLLCGAMELDTRTGALCARAQHNPATPYPTFALALTLFDQPAWEVLSPERPLRYWRLIEINQPGAQPLITSALKADERIVNYLKGLNYLDDRLSPVAAAVPVTRETALPGSQRAQADVIVSHIKAGLVAGRPPLLQLLGADTSSKLLIAAEVASRLGVTLYRLSADALPSQSAELENFARLWQRESALLPIALYLDCAHLDGTGGAHAAPIKRVLSRNPGLKFIDTREPWSDLDHHTLMLDIAKPTSDEQRQAWIDAVGEARADSIRRVAGHFNLDVLTISQVARDALASSGDDISQLAETLWKGCLRRSRPALDRLARPLEPKATWDDLELAATEKQLLRQIADQVEQRLTVYDDWGFRERMNRGLGISVLFAGESGTGKTMAAEVIANELGLLLYRIDLSAVVSKYIGETEKNLRKLFDAAEDGGAILLFDEADALFGKRSEVKDSHDRYANIEINYLLQRMEAYRGLAILATNMKSALDTAFVRRLRFIVNFAFPGSVERTAIWRKAFPGRTPVGALDFQRLARLNLTGGSIQNIALNAAFRAAQANTQVTMPLVLEAARNEFRKLEKPINEADFRWLESAGVKS